MRPAAVIIIAYLLGSIPFGYLIVKTTRGGDIRETGSGGTGATNVSRRAGKGAGIATLVLDALKGAAAVLIAQMILPRVDGDCWVAAAAIAVIIGHIFPIWLRFRGGKGVATDVGVFLVLAPWAVLVAGIIFVVIVWRTRYVSLGSIVATASIPLFVLMWNYIERDVEDLHIVIAAFVAGALIIFAHRENIGRLIQGTESEFK